VKSLASEISGEMLYLLLSQRRYKYRHKRNSLHKQGLFNSELNDEIIFEVHKI